MLLTTSEVGFSETVWASAASGLRLHLDVVQVWRRRLARAGGEQQQYRTSHRNVLPFEASPDQRLRARDPTNGFRRMLGATGSDDGGRFGQSALVGWFVGRTAVDRSKEAGMLRTNTLTAIPTVELAQPKTADPEQAFLDRFYAGERTTLGEIYRHHFDRVEASVGTVLVGADRETVIHEVFFRLLRDEAFRRAFRGGDLGAWLAVVGRNRAIDYTRHRNRELPAGIDLGNALSTGDELARSAEARLLIERFVRDVLPPAWRGLFEARFIFHLKQSEAAAALGKRRTTLAYQELRIRQMLRKFLLEDA